MRLSGTRAVRGPMGASGTAEEQALLKRALNGDREALGDLFKIHYPSMYYLALRYTGSEDHAHDVLQDAYVRVIRHIGQFRGDSQFSSWMARIVINSARLRHRRNKRLVAVGDRLELDEVSPEVDPERRVSDHQLLTQVEEFLRSLREGDLQLFVRRFVRGQSVSLISAETGVSVPAVKTRVHRARSKLRARFEDVLAAV